MHKMEKDLVTCVMLCRMLGHHHPARELNNGEINDAEYLMITRKRLDEMRHQTALKCVELGIFKDIFEAKEYNRKLMIKQSDYKYKHLLYKE